ncbi:MAG: hypothetical protein HWQ43_15005 [Nostoc sp. JL31]|uniref:hypothetical protein n=1 Tax=Nostoc sp. JL31 TaxID=2815395 RepID=UPI0025F26DDC|nr:hypothetical protein [Nostoc sp. JL31]MBN3890410.1 hypothetical protein [Nostoc sp. JL31]
MSLRLRATAIALKRAITILTIPTLNHAVLALIAAVTVSMPLVATGTLNAG